MEIIIMFDTKEKESKLQFLSIIQCITSSHLYSACNWGIDIDNKCVHMCICLDVMGVYLNVGMCVLSQFWGSL